MSLRAATATAVGFTAPASEFWLRFIRDAHRLVAEGFSQLNAAALSDELEEDISGAIKEGIYAWYDAAGRPDWTRVYTVEVERPVQGAKRGNKVRKGKNRPRIDIVVESNEGPARPPCFSFEAKRFYRSDSVAEYVGTAGLGTFLDGTKAADADAAGMLGYVQDRIVEAAVDDVCDKLNKERATHRITSTGSVWMGCVIDARLGTTYVSRHGRTTPLGEIDVYHSFLCCRAA